MIVFDPARSGKGARGDPGAWSGSSSAGPDLGPGGQQSRSDLRSVCRNADPGYSAWIVVGGDGTVNEVLQETRADGPPIGIWPAGTANLLARELGFSRDPELLARWVREGASRRIDLGLCAGPGRAPRRFAACAGAGLDARGVEGVGRRRKGPSHWTRHAAAVAEALGRRGTKVKAKLDGKAFGEGWMAVASNSSLCTRGSCGSRPGPI